MTIIERYALKDGTELGLDDGHKPERKYDSSFHPGSVILVFLNGGQISQRDASKTVQRMVGGTKAITTPKRITLSDKRIKDPKSAKAHAELFVAKLDAVIEEKTEVQRSAGRKPKELRRTPSTIRRRIVKAQYHG